MKSLLLALLLLLPLSGKSAVSLDGTDDYVLTSDIAAMDSLTACTVSCWIKQDVLTVSKCFLGKYDAGAVVGLLFQTGATSKSNILFGFSGTAYITTTGGGLSSTGVWYHVCGVFSTNTTPKHKIYIGGVLQSASNTGSPESTASTGASSEPFRIGRLSTATTRYWNGKISDVRIYNLALSASEVANLASSRLKRATPMNGLLAYWPLDSSPEGSVMTGNVFPDIVGGYHGYGSNGVIQAAETLLTYP